MGRPVDDEYLTDDYFGDGWELHLGDSCERLAEVPDNSIGMTAHSPPFADLFVYSGTTRDMGNSADTAEFIDHYSFVIDHLLRITMPGRLACVHVQQLATTKVVDGVIGVEDFRGEIIRAYTAAGWIFHGEVTVWKNPQAQAIIGNTPSLSFAALHRDGAAVRPAFADYLLLFRKPGDNPVKVKTDATNEDWIEWASPIWLDNQEGGTPHGEGLLPVWMDIRETDTLNKAIARADRDGRHICPLQLEFIRRCVRLYSNPGDRVLTPCAGIGSEVYVAYELGRYGIGYELKKSYYDTAVVNLCRLEAERSGPSLFELSELDPQDARHLAPERIAAAHDRAAETLVQQAAELERLVVWHCEQAAVFRGNETGALAAAAEGIDGQIGVLADAASDLRGRVGAPAAEWRLE